ncbi:MAG: DUF488 domain-containing protein [Methanobacteriota archaeon]
MVVRTKPVRASPSPADGYRVLVDRRLPAGVSRAGATIHAHLPELAPSERLRRFLKEDRPGRFEEFRRRYTQELRAKASLLDALTERARRGPVTFVHGSRDRIRNPATVLREVLRLRLGLRARPAGRLRRVVSRGNVSHRPTPRRVPEEGATSTRRTRAIVRRQGAKGTTRQ